MHIFEIHNNHWMEKEVEYYKNADIAYDRLVKDLQKESYEQELKLYKTPLFAKLKKQIWEYQMLTTTTSNRGKLIKSDYIKGKAKPFVKNQLTTINKINILMFSTNELQNPLEIFEKILPKLNKHTVVYWFAQHTVNPKHTENHEPYPMMSYIKIMDIGYKVNWKNLNFITSKLYFIYNLLYIQNLKNIKIERIPKLGCSGLPNPKKEWWLYGKIVRIFNIYTQPKEIVEKYKLQLKSIWKNKVINILKKDGTIQSL